jgi:hypothetical protein
MARQPHAGHAGCSGSERGGRGGRFLKKNEPSSLPHKGGEDRACKDLEGNVFTIGSGNKGKDGDMLCTSKEKLALYIGTNYGDDACQEWFSEKQLVLQEPTYPDAVLARHRLRGIAVTNRVTKMFTSLEKQLQVINTELLLVPNDLNLLKSQMEVENKLELAKFDLLAGNVGICVCWLHHPNDRHFWLSLTCCECRPNTLVTFCYVGQYFGCQCCVGEFCC